MREISRAVDKKLQVNNNPKTRSALKQLCGLCSPYLWDFKKEKFVPNPNGQGNAGLYIGTEMDLYIELEPILWCIISGVSEKKLKDNDLTEEEEERIQMAMEYAKEMQLFLEDEEDFDVNFLWQTVERYKINHNIKMVCLDYIELNGALVSEYVSVTKGMPAREDQILLNLSKNCKAICKKYDLTMIAYTQTNDEGRRQEARDQTAVKGGKSLPNKADLGYTVFAPTVKELELLEPVITEATKGINNRVIPNVCLTIYKNRWFNPKDVKIWGYQDLGTGQFIDLFCTDKNYNVLNISKTKINLANEEE